MGKHLRHKHSGLSYENHNAGCMWGILHILDYHHWRHVKKMLPYKRHGGGKRARVRHPETKINFSEFEDNTDATETESSVIGERTTVPSTGTKGSVKSRIKARFSGEISKRKGKHRRCSTYPAQAPLTRTDSIHHLEPSEEDPLTEVILNVDSPRIAQPDGESSSSSKDPTNSEKKYEDCGNMLCVNYLGHNQVHNVHGKQLVDNHTLLQEKLDNAKQDLLEQKLAYAKEHTKDAPLYQSKEFLDALDIVSLDKELFLKVLQDQGSPLADHFHGRQACSTKKGLAKSGTFPIPSSSDQQRVPGPGELEQKLKEIRNQAQKLAGFWSGEYTSGHEMPGKGVNMVSENSKAGQTRPETSDIASSSPTHLKNGNDNQMAIKRFKDLKRRIKHAIKESKKERHRITMDAVLHKIPYGRKFSKDVKKEHATDKDGKYSPANSYESDQSGPVLNKRRMRHMRRTSSLTDSMDRYCQLYESTFNSGKYPTPERLKLRAEEVSSPGWSAQKLLGRIHSLPDLKAYYQFQNEDSSDSLYSRTPIRTMVDSTGTIENSFGDRKTLEVPRGLGGKKQLNALVESGSEENLVDVGENNSDDTSDQAEEDLTSVEFSLANAELRSLINDLGNLTTRHEASHHEPEIGSISELTIKLPEPSRISVLDSSFHKDMDSPATLSIPEDALADKQEPNTDSPAVAETRVDLEKVEVHSKHLDSDYVHLQVNTEDKDEFNYVRDVLEHSGIIRNELLETWDAAGQPVDPSVYEEVEGILPLGHEYFENEEAGYYNHLLLFDLINEVLMEIYDRSFSYCPIPLSTLKHIRPMPVGYHVLEEVWANISWYLQSRPELDQSLDYLVSRDLSKGDGWMNLQFDTECVGLELEDIIFDSLLEEVICTSLAY